jgi:hypothetical protein
MADWSDTNPQETTPYVSVLPALRDRDKDAYMLAESPTNPPTGAIRYVRASNKFQEWDGAAWADKTISIAGGGTGATTAANARTALGLGSMATQNNNAINVTGGTISGITAFSTSGNAAINGNLGVTGTAAIDGLATFAAGTLVANSAPFYKFSDTSQGVDEKNWDIISFGKTFKIRTVNDALSSVVNILDVVRGTGTAVASAVLQVGNNFLSLTPTAATLFGTGAGTGTTTINGGSIGLSGTTGITANAAVVAISGSSFIVSPVTDITLTASATISITGVITDITSTSLNLISNDIDISSLVATGTGTDLVKNGSGKMVLKTSSIRYKENVGDFNLDTRNFMSALVPVRFDYINSTKNVIGFIAEEIHSHYPELVNLNDKNQPESIRTDSLIAYMFYTMRIMYARLLEVDNYLLGNSPLG